MSDPSPATPRRAATILDIARAAGISHATVSRYLNGRSYVAAATRADIERAIAAVGYVPNSSARSLVSKRTGTVAFVVREDPDQFFGDTNLVGQARGANAALSGHGYQQLLMIVDSPASEARIRRLITGRLVDGALLASMRAADQLALDLDGAGVPLVTSSSPLPGSGVASVDVDNRAAARQITARLRATGRRLIGEVRGPVDAPVSALRQLGVADVLGAMPGGALFADAENWTPAAGRAAARILLDRAPDLDGVVAASDSLAAGVLDELTAAGRRVPGDVGVVGFDDSPWALRVRPALSTVRQDGGETGRRMADLLVRILGGEPLAGYRETVPTTIVWRDSA